MILLIDNSNRTTKLALGNAEGISESWQCRLPSADLEADEIREAVGDWSEIERVAFCSVTETGPAMLRQLAAGMSLPCFEASSLTMPLDLTGYPAPESIGPDRLANAVAAAALFPDQEVVAIDAGTAITFNVIRPGAIRPLFCGGAIAPGLGLFTRALAESTDRLPEIEFPDEPPMPAIGNSTLTAMQSAAWHGLAGLLNGILDALVPATRPNAVVVTGSDADIVSHLLARPCHHAPWLTLDGLRRAACRALVPLA